MIAIIFIGNIDNCPYIEKYKKILMESNIDYEVLFWNREDNGKKYPSNYIYFNKKSSLGKKKLYKVPDFLQYMAWLKKSIQKKKYTKFIILDTLSGMLLSRKLLREYQGKYIFDIRDYSYEKFKFFYDREEKLIDSSNFTCISSQGFKSFLPKDKDYVMAHNFNYDELTLGKTEFVRKKSYGEQLNVVWIGSVRYFEHQVKIIDKLKNDNRFNIIIHGTGPDLERLMGYCEKELVKNIKFTGRYDNKEKASLLSNADIINNSYDVNVGPEVKFAISNKYYDGLIFRIPQLVEAGTYKHKRVEELGIGVGLDVEVEDFADKLYNYYFEINEEKYNKACDKEIEKILEEDKNYLDKIREFINT